MPLLPLRKIDLHGDDQWKLPRIPDLVSTIHQKILSKIISKFWHLKRHPKNPEQSHRSLIRFPEIPTALGSTPLSIAMPRPRCLPLALLAALLLGLARSPSFALPGTRRQLLAAAVAPLVTTVAGAAARAEEEIPLGSIPKDGDHGGPWGIWRWENGWKTVR